MQTISQRPQLQIKVSNPPLRTWEAEQSTSPIKFIDHMMIERALHRLSEAGLAQMVGAAVIKLAGR